MEKIYSKVEEGKLLHIINRLDEITGRTEVVPENNFIQCATLKMENGKTFPPHKHITKDKFILLMSKISKLHFKSPYYRDFVNNFWCDILLLL